MSLLLDSNALLRWAGLHHGWLAEPVKNAIAEADRLFVSVATVWELEIKRATRKLAFAQDAWSQVEALGIEWLPVELADAVEAARLPLIHRDPFDRMIVAQARRRGLTLVTADGTLADYGVAILKA